jgi:hypothetical protein
MSAGAEGMATADEEVVAGELEGGGPYCAATRAGMATMRRDLANIDDGRIVSCSRDLWSLHIGPGM